MGKPILSIDFDGVLHSYKSGWQGADVCGDPPVDGAMRFLMDASDHFAIAIFSSRSHQPDGRAAMKAWTRKHFLEHWSADRTRAEDVLAEIDWPVNKPAAFLSIDDRAFMFKGEWPEAKAMLTFLPWNKLPPIVTSG